MPLLIINNNWANSQQNQIVLFEESQTPAELRAFGWELLGRLELFFGDEMLVEGNVQHASYFTNGPAWNIDEPGEVLVAAAFEAFGDVVHYGDGGSTKLVAQASVGSQIRVPAERIDHVC